MFDDAPQKKLSPHEVGMGLDAMSVEELTERIGLLETEIGRLQEALAARQKTKSAAEALFKF